MSIYIVYAVDAGERSQQQQQKEFEIMKIKYGKPNWSFNEYERFKKSWRDFKYYANLEPMAYCKSMDDAKYAVVNNICDFNECGSYPYAAIAVVPMDYVYPESYMTEGDVLTYRYNIDQDQYELMKDGPIHDRIVQEIVGIRGGGEE